MPTRVKPTLIVLAAVALICAAPVAATAHASKVRTIHVPTRITHDGDIALGNGQVLLAGQVEARRSICRSLRVVVVDAFYSNGDNVPLDLESPASSAAPGR